ncbi:MAG: hypothetical protein FWC46_03740 [Actinomycetia bacterium]|nr:hypothetical protein [Actinomycetes bacterium]
MNESQDKQVRRIAHLGAGWLRQDLFRPRTPCESEINKLQGRTIAQASLCGVTLPGVIRPS